MLAIKNTMNALLRLLPLAGILVGIVFMASQISALQEYRRRQAWLPVPAVVESVQIAGHRAFHPEIALRYIVAGKTYTMTSSMNVPGFGSKRNRLDVAERITSSLAVGDTLTVFVDPDHPADAVVLRRLSYATYLILTTGFCFAVSGMVFMVLRRSQAQ